MSEGDDVRSDASGVKLTYDDFLLFPDDGQRHELIGGEHYVTPSPNPGHQVILGNLYWLIRSHLEVHPIGQVFLSPLDVVFSRLDVVEPDLLYLSHERAASVLTPQHLIGAPEWAVEIGSPSTERRDETVKLRLYERFGVTEYWIVDPDRLTVRVHRRHVEQFDVPIELSLERGDAFTTTILPGLRLPLAEIFKNLAVY